METYSLSDMFKLRSSKQIEPQIENEINSLKNYMQNFINGRNQELDKCLRFEQQLDSKLAILKDLSNLNNKQEKISAEMQIADKWLEKDAPHIEEKLSGIENKKLTIRSVVAEQIQETLAFKLVKYLVPTSLLLGVGIIMGGVTIGGFQIDSVMTNSRETNREINDIAKGFESTLNEKINTNIRNINVSLERKQSEATSIVDDINAKQSEVKNAVSQIKSDLNDSTSFLGEINRSKSDAQNALQELRTNLQRNVATETDKYLDSRFGVENTKSLIDIKQEIEKLNITLSNMEARISVLNKNYLTIVAVVAGFVGIILGFIALIRK